MSDVEVVLKHSDGDDLRFPMVLYTSAINDAPERSDRAGVYPAGRIDVDISNVSLEGFRTKIVDGRRTYKIVCTIRVHFGAAEGLLKFNTLVHDEVCGSTSISFVDE